MYEWIYSEIASFLKRKSTTAGNAHYTIRISEK
jgi:hypothetical protein